MSFLNSDCLCSTVCSYFDSGTLLKDLKNSFRLSSFGAVDISQQKFCIFFIDISEEEGLRRKKEQKKLDRMEQESIDFHHMVSEGYRKVLSDRDEVVYIDGLDEVDNIQKKIRDSLKNRGLL